MQLLERQSFLDELGAALSDATVKGGCVCAMSGEAGIGKSALADQFSSQVRQQTRTRVLRGWCDALYTPRPLGPLIDVANALGGRLAGLLTEGGSRDRIFDATRAELARESAVVILEDVHWADEATFDLLRFLSRRIAQTPSVLVITYRDDELSTGHPLHALLSEIPRDSLRRIALQRLSASAIIELARRAGRSAEGVYALTSGNPYFASEVLSSPAGEIPASFRDSVLARAARLPAETRRLLDLVAIVPGRTELALLETVAAARPDELSACNEVGLLQSAGSHVSFRHELARQAWETGLDQFRAGTLHVRVMSFLRENGLAESNPARLVHHATRASDHAAVREYAPRAAREAAAIGAHREAAAHYALAVRHSEGLPPAERADLLEALAQEYVLTGSVKLAADVRTEALALRRQLGDQNQVGANLRMLGRIAWFRGDDEAVRKYAAEAIAVLEPLGESAELARAYSFLAQVQMCSDQNEESIPWGRKALELARRLDDQDTIIHALNNLGSALMQANYPDGQELLQESLDRALAAHWHDHAGRAFVNLGITAATRRDFTAAIPRMDDGLRFCIDHDLDSYTLCLYGDRALLRCYRGEWGAAMEDCAIVREHPRAPPVDLIPVYVVLGRVAARRGDPAARELLEKGYELAIATGEIARIAPVAASLAELAWLEGQPERIADATRHAWELALDRRTEWWIGELAYWRSRAGLLDTMPEPIAEPYRLMLEQSWEEAAAAWQRIGAPYERALCLAQSDRAESTETAIRILHELGAPRTVEVLTRELRQRGVRGLPRGPRASTRANPANLTDKQFRILTLLADGLSNAAIADKLFLSPKTVEHHVSAVIGKLGVRTRAEAAARARALGALAPQTRGPAHPN